MVNSCSAFGCTNRFSKGSGIGFYRFPSNLERRNRWINALRRENWKPTQDSRICGVHFESGRPADSFDETHPDWAPSINLGYTLKRKPFHMTIIDEYETDLKEQVKKRSKQKKRTSMNDGVLTTIKPHVKSITNFQIPAAVEEICGVQVDTQIMRSTDIEKVRTEDTECIPENSQMLGFDNTELLESEDIERVKLENLQMLDPAETSIVGDLGKSHTDLSPECLPKNRKNALNEVCRTLEEIYTTYHDVDEDVDLAFCNLIKMLLQNVPHKNKRNIQKQILNMVKNAIEIV